MDKAVTDTRQLEPTQPKGQKAPVQEKPARKSRPYVYELDPLRATTALIVVAVHAVALTAFLNHSASGLQLQNALVTALHYTREMFMFVTAFALVYVYFGRPFSAKRFWTKRATGVLVPYALWTLIYILVNQPNLSPLDFARTALIDLLNGQASYQLYYILLTLQFYLLFPLFLPLVSIFKKYPWQSLGISFALEVLILYVDYHTLGAGIGTNQPFWNFIAQYQNSIVLIYQFYFVLGAVAALYISQIRTFLARHGWWTAIGFVLGLGLLWGHFFLQVRYYNEPLGRAVSVLQPVMTFYSLGIIAFAFWLAYRWASRVGPDGRPSGLRIWGTLSNASFGVYLIHALILNWLLRWWVPGLPQAWPVGIRVFLTWFVTASGAAIASIILMNIPILSRMVGRTKPLPSGIIHLKWWNKPEAKSEQVMPAQDIHKE